MKRMRRLAVILPLLLLAGCASGVLVGGGKGGDAVRRYPGDGDARIIHEVNRRLMADPQVPAMDVEVEAVDGVVTLRGQVPTRAAAEQAVRIARSVQGVKAVRNVLRVER